MKSQVTSIEQSRRLLELKDIAAYLPYKPKFVSEYFSTPHDIDSINFAEKMAEFSNLDGYTQKEIGEAHLLLRPMSDLTKEITHRGETFVPMGRLKLIDSDVQFNYGKLYSQRGYVLEWIVSIIDKLAEWMFDYRGLIPAGLAVDVNTLPENPYEV